MLILAIDTCFGTCSAAIGEIHGERVTFLAEASRDSGPGHAEALLPMIEGIVREIRSNGRHREFELRHIARIAVTRGPGTFTGVRTGIAAARGLALALGVPTLSATSLATIASAVRREAGEGMLDHDVVVAMPAGRGWLYVERFAGGGLLSDGPRAMLECDAEQAIGPAGAILAGTEAPTLARSAQTSGKPVHAVFDHLLPSAGELLSLTRQLNPDLLPVAPLYLRAPDAKPQTDSSLPRAKE